MKHKSMLSESVVFQIFYITKEEKKISRECIAFVIFILTLKTSELFYSNIGKNKLWAVFTK